MPGEAPYRKGPRTSDVRAVPVALGAVLVVMDKADELNFVAFALRRRGHEVRCERSANDAATALSSRRFHALVADDMLADADGRSLLREARARGVRGTLLLGATGGSGGATSDGAATGELRFKRPMPIVALVRCVEGLIAEARKRELFEPDDHD